VVERGELAGGGEAVQRGEVAARYVAEFTLEYWRDEGWYLGRLKEVPGVFSQGETLEALEANIRDAYRLVMEDDESELPAGVLTKEIGVEVEAP
jgi:predicted RNase H-like HicB family nuclease